MAWNCRLKFEPCEQKLIKNILAHASLKSKTSVFEDLLFFLLLFAVIFANFFLYFINEVIKTAYFVSIKSNMTHECRF